MMRNSAGVRNDSEIWNAETRTNSEKDLGEGIKCSKRGHKVLRKKFWRRHVITWLIATAVILSSSLVVRNNNENLITIAIVVICTTTVVLLIPTLADIIHKLIDDLDIKE
jgi:hypothetical protein